LGKKRIFKWAAKYANPDEGAEVAFIPSEAQQDTLVMQHAPEEVSKPDVIVREIEPIQEVETKEDTLKVKEEAVTTKPKPPVQSTLAPGLYVIAGSFRNLPYARNHQQKLMQLGQVAEIGLNPKNGLYYVYIFSSYNVEECKEVVNLNKLKEATREVWILRIE
jgi:cell division protein FtsN